MTISTQTQKAITPIIRGMATAGTLPKTEANAVCNLLKDASALAKTHTTKNKHVMLTASQASKQLGVCVKTVLRMYWNGQLRGIKITGSHKSLRFPESEVERIINEGVAK